jgi:hypothetical protein
MTARDPLVVLAQDILDATWPDGDTTGFPSSRVATMLAEHLLAAGYGKPLAPVKLEPHHAKITPENALEILSWLSSPPTTSDTLYVNLTALAANQGGGR